MKTKHKKEALFPQLSGINFRRLRALKRGNFFAKLQAVKVENLESCKNI